jgi:cytochrome c oxidase cbb3-type subunit 3
MSDRDRKLGHSYDGIEEYDNPLPGWWSWLFVATIVFSVGYYAYYQIGPGPTILARYEAEMRAADEQQARLAAAAGGAISEASLRALVKDARAMAAAKEVFATRCMPCHGAEGQGLIGPNLTDEYWKHGGTLVDIRRTIHDGVPDKGMVPWKDQLKPDELSAVAAFIGTLAGTNPPGPKPPEGVTADGRAAPGAPAAAAR